MLDKFEQMGPGRILALRDFDMEFTNPAPIMVRKLKDVLTVGKSNYKHIVIIGCEFNLPKQLEKEFVRIDFGLPNEDQLLEIAENIASSAGQQLNGSRDAIAKAASWLDFNRS